MSAAVLDLSVPVCDWRENMHVAHDPCGVFFAFDPDTDFEPEWQRLFSVPYVEQTLSDYTANPSWLALKQNFISASECAAALDENVFETLEEYILFKAGIVPKELSARGKTATEHGKRKEDVGGALYVAQAKDLAFRFGLIPHESIPYIAISPDLVCKLRHRIAELKSPLYRWIIPTDVSSMDCKPVQEATSTGQYKLDAQVSLLLQEVKRSPTDRHRYLAITNLPLHVTRLLEEYRMYWHQVQCQWEVLRIGDTIDFVQFGTSPNEYYPCIDLLTVTQVEADWMWIQTYGDKLRKTWDEITYYRRAPETERQALLQAWKAKHPEQAANRTMSEDDLLMATCGRLYRRGTTYRKQPMPISNSTKEPLGKRRSLFAGCPDFEVYENRQPDVRGRATTVVIRSTSNNK